MVGTIAPAVRGGNGAAMASFLVGHAFAGAAFGALLGALGLALPSSPSLRWPLLAALAALAGLHDYGVVKLPLPQLRRQVPSEWRRRFSPSVAWFLYGVGLGSGVATRVPHAVYWVAAAAVALVARPLDGALLFAAYGLARGVVALAVSVAVAG